MQFYNNAPHICYGRGGKKKFVGELFGNFVIVSTTGTIGVTIFYTVRRGVRGPGRAW